MNNDIKLSDRTKEIVLYAFDNPNMNQVELSKHFGISPQRISQIMKSDRVLKSFPVLAKRKVASLLPKAVDRLEHLMNQDVNMNVAEKVVSKVLDHAKVLEPQPQHIIHELRLKTTEELQAIVDQGKTIQGPVIDAELI